jgi:hypothetical protein
MTELMREYCYQGLAELPERFRALMAESKGGENNDSQDRRQTEAHSRARGYHSSRLDQ